MQRRQVLSIMYILLTAATNNEIGSTIEWLKMNDGTVSGHEVEVLITGIGGTVTAFSLTKHMDNRTPELVIQAGIGGSFHEQFPPESVVVVKEEVFADLGAFEDDGFSDIFDLGLAGADDQPFSKRLLPNPHLGLVDKFALPHVRGATINCISSTRMQVNAISQKYAADVESMEGAALHYTCLLQQVPFLQLRAVSNFVGERDKRKWKMKESITALNRKLREILMDI